MWNILGTYLHRAISALKTQPALALENRALRNQLAVYERQSKKPRLEDLDRLVWIKLRQFWPGWQTALTLDQPATVVKWHRKGLGAFWRRKSRSSAGRLRIDRDIRKVIRDRDGIYHTHFVCHVRSMGIDEVLTAPRSPSQSPYCERLVSSIRREYLDHIIVVNEPQQGCQPFPANSQ